jgi:hypothetical protein
MPWVSGVPSAIERLDALLSAAMIAHEAIFEMRRELIAGDRANPDQARLLEESARIVTSELPSLSDGVRQLSTRWSEQSLLDPAAAVGTLEDLEDDLAQIEPGIRSLLDRQREIAGRLRSMLDP